jgi:hypothetical protein
MARRRCRGSRARSPAYVLAELVEGFGSSASGYREWMKPKTMFYTALGFATYKVGKHMAKRKARQALAGQTPDKKT